MKQRRVWRYTCDHCRKSGCGKAAMRDHEARCFKNPARHCPVCERQWPIEELEAPIAACSDMDKGNEAALIQSISDAVEQCPACICAAIIQAPLPMLETVEDGPLHRYWCSWDYKKARDEYRAEQRQEEASYL